MVKTDMTSQNIAKITYLYNSGIAIEIRDILLIFDYCFFVPTYHGEGLTSGIIPTCLFREKRRVYVFVTHGHIDHYNEEIWKWDDIYKNIVYIISDDIAARKNANCIRTGMKLRIDDLEIVGCPSNDVGVSYFVDVYDLKIFHAGDLNLWYRAPKDGMNQKRAKIEYQIAKMNFLKALTPIKELDIDIAFFPVDPQIGGKYYEGGIMFCKEINPKVFVPVHFRTHYFVTRKFKEIMNETDVKIWAIHYRGDQYIFDKY